MDVARAAVEEARSPLEAIEAYGALAAAAKEAGKPVRAAMASLRALQLWDSFALPAPVMATRFDHLRHGAAFRTVNIDFFGRCPERDRSQAMMAWNALQPCEEDLGAEVGSLPEPQAPAGGTISAGTTGAAPKDIEGLLDCAVCYGTLYEPVTVACGHSFCRRCLARQLDFERGCPLCRAQLSGFVDQYPVTAGLGEAIEVVAPGSAAQGQAAVQKEVDDMKDWLPVFVCMLAFPTQACPLHIFEPRYRLMMRRAVSSGLRRFGMCVPMSGPPDVAQNGYSRVGTVLFIREMRMLVDGRSLVDCVGETRFKVRECSERDGYNVARVELIEEEAGPAPLELVAGCRRALAAFRTQLIRRAGGLGNPETEDDPEEDEAFFWHAVEILPIPHRFKFAALITEGRTKRFELLAALLEAAQERMRAENGEGGSGPEEERRAQARERGGAEADEDEEGEDQEGEDGESEQQEQEQDEEGEEEEEDDDGGSPQQEQDAPPSGAGAA